MTASFLSNVLVTASVADWIGAAIGTVISHLILVCFVVGLAVRVVQGLSESFAGTTGRSGKRERRSGRELSDDAPVIRRRRRHRDDPALQLRRGRR